MVLIPVVEDAHYCIDAFETTNAMYAAYLATGPSPETASWATVCETEGLGLAPAAGWPPDASAGEVPVASVTWCQAHAFCQADGKRLCGRVGGGSLDLAEVNVNDSPHVSEWGFACTAGGTQPYPYGQVLDGARCNAPGGTWTPDTPPFQVHPSGDFPLCEGGFAGVFQLMGNVLEWEDACSDINTDLDNPFCVARGRNFKGGCYTKSYAGADQDTFVGSFEDITGIRCCADAVYLPPEEQ